LNREKPLVEHQVIDRPTHRRATASDGCRPRRQGAVAIGAADLQSPMERITI
jgi:hypothetical protein